MQVYMSAKRKMPMQVNRGYSTVNNHVWDKANPCKNKVMKCDIHRSIDYINRQAQVVVKTA